MKLRDEQKEANIIDATLRLVFRQGLAGLKMNDIAKEAQMAVGTLYIYFKNKEELLNEIFLRYKRECLQALGQNIDYQLPFKSNFKQMWHNYLHFALEKPEQAALLEQLRHSPYLREETREEATHLLQPIKEVLDVGKAQLLIKHMDNDLLLAFLSGSINQLARHCIEKCLAPSQELFEQAFTLAWDAVRA